MPCFLLFFHLWTILLSSLCYSAIPLQTLLLNELNVTSDIFAITELHIKKVSSSLLDLQLDKHSTECTPTELSYGDKVQLTVSAFSRSHFQEKGT